MDSTELRKLIPSLTVEQQIMLVSFCAEQVAHLEDHWEDDTHRKALKAYIANISAEDFAYGVSNTLFQRMTVAYMAAATMWGASESHVRFSLLTKRTWNAVTHAWKIHPECKEEICLYINELLEPDEVFEEEVFGE